MDGVGLGFDLALTGFDAEEITGIQAAVAADGAEGDQFFFYGVKKPPSERDPRGRDQEDGTVWDSVGFGSESQFSRVSD